MKLKLLKKSALVIEFSRYILLIMYMASLDFIQNPLLGIVPALIGTAVVYLATKAIKATYYEVKIYNPKEEKKSVIYAGASSLALIFIINALSVGGPKGMMFAFLFFMLFLFLNKKSVEFIEHVESKKI